MSPRAASGATSPTIRRPGGRRVPAGQDLLAALRCLTPTGRRGLLSAGAVTLLGLALGYPELVVIGAGAVAVMAGCVLVALPVPRISATAALTPRRVVRGGTAQVTVTLATAHGRPSPPCVVELAYRGGARRIVSGSLPPRSETTITVPLRQQHRGRVAVGPLVARRGDPLGVVVRRFPLGDVGVLWVLPVIHPLAPRPLNDRNATDLGREGEHGRGDSSFGFLREYRVGDNLRAIHWPSTARIGSLMVREDVDLDGRVCTVLLDVSARAYPDGEAAEQVFEEAVDVVASLLVAYVAQGFGVQLRSTAAGDRAIRLSPGASALSGPLMEALVDVRMIHDAVRTHDLATAVRAASREGPVAARGPLTVVSGPRAVLPPALPGAAAGGSPLVVRVGVEPAAPPSGNGPRPRTLDVRDAADLARRWPAPTPRRR